MQFPPTPAPRLGGPVFWPGSTGGRPNSDDSLHFGAAHFGRIDRIAVWPCGQRRGHNREVQKADLWTVDQINWPHRTAVVKAATAEYGMTLIRRTGSLGQDHPVDPLVGGVGHAVRESIVPALASRKSNRDVDLQGRHGTWQHPLVEWAGHPAFGQRVEGSCRSTSDRWRPRPARSPSPDGGLMSKSRSCPTAQGHARRDHVERSVRSGSPQRTPWDRCTERPPARRSEPPQCNPPSDCHRRSAGVWFVRSGPTMPRRAVDKTPSEKAPPIPASDPGWLE